ncbi:hypothetical protein GAGA_0141 [Paraglaciecola agarilytica NO2]|uniref:Uncharacterized protein n=1 Tax=Paraglaciecola agarilytica NO2 TaxID=1125747 RepID=A0ABQ0I121_9ALTE|nr:hypothetical protein GAGA_0141 [Paraglaciecola agarilytica NO2]
MRIDQYSQIKDIFFTAFIYQEHQMYEALILLIPLAMLVIGTMLVIRYPKKTTTGDDHRD